MPRLLANDTIETVRAEIGQAALRIYSREGVEGVTIRQLARLSGRSPMGLYHYFKDREDIIAYLRTAAFNRFSEELELAFASGGDAFTRARNVGRAYLNFAKSNPEMYRLMFDMSQPDDARYPALGEAAKRAGETVTRHVIDLANAGVVTGDPQIVGRALWAAAHGVVVLYLAGRLPPGADVDSFYRDTMRIAFRGARATPSRSTPQ